MVDAPNLNPEEYRHGNVKQHLSPERIRRGIDNGFARL